MKRINNISIVESENGHIRIDVVDPEIRKYVIHLTLYEDVNIKLPDNQIAGIKRIVCRYNKETGAFEKS